MRSAPTTITLVGTVDPRRRSNIGSEIAGIVAEMPVRQGDLVKTGQLLCKLRDDILTLRLTEAQANLGALAVRHEELLAGLRPEELTRLKAILDETASEEERWTFEMKRIERLYEGSVSNAKEYQDTLAEFRAAERRRIAAQASYELGVAGPRQEEIARAAYDVAEQQAVVDRLKSELEKTSIRSPFDGFVTKRASEVGEWVAVGGAILEIIDLSSVLVRVNVPEFALPYVQVDDRARVMVDALKRTFDGRVKHVIRQADEKARTFPVDIEVDNPEALLSGGMFARAAVPAGSETEAVAVPKDAIVERDGIANVAIVIPGRQGGTVGMLVSVTVGADVGDWITITSGNVQPGTIVITRGNEHVLPFPTPVSIVDDKGVPVDSSPHATKTAQRRDE